MIKNQSARRAPRRAPAAAADGADIDPLALVEVTVARGELHYDGDKVARVGDTAMVSVQEAERLKRLEIIHDDDEEEPEIVPDASVAGLRITTDSPVRIGPGS